MTIKNPELNHRLERLAACAEHAPEGTYQDVKDAVACIDEAIESVRSIFRDYGFKVNGTDPCRNLEVAIYGYMLESNPDRTTFPVGEGFGAAMDTPRARDVIQQAARNRDFLRTMGVIP